MNTFPETLKNIKKTINDRITTPYLEEGLLNRMPREGLASQQLLSNIALLVMNKLKMKCTWW